MRIAHQVKSDELMVNMFTGVDCFSIVIAKNSLVRSVFSIDVNPDAWKYAKRNVSLNGVEGIVTVLLGVQPRLSLQSCTG